MTNNQMNQNVIHITIPNRGNDLHHARINNKTFEISIINVAYENCIRLNAHNCSLI